MKRLINKYLLRIIICVAFFLAFYSQSFAHVLENNGSIGAVLHMTPEDDPVANEATGFFLDFKDTNGKFGVDICHCQYLIKENGNTVFSASLNNDDKPNQASFLYAFPKKGLYELVVTGTPVLPNTFQPFKLSYTIRVDKEAQKSSPSTTNNINWLGSHIYHLLAGVIILAMSAVFIVLRLMGKIKD